MNKFQIEKMITDMENKLEETRDSVSWNSGAIKDTMMITIPMLEDQLKIMRALLELCTR